MLIELTETLKSHLISKANLNHIIFKAIAPSQSDTWVFCAEK